MRDFVDKMFDATFIYLSTDTKAAKIIRVSDESY